MTMSPSNGPWRPGDIIIPPHGLEIRKNGRPNYAKALGRKTLASVTGIIGSNNAWSKDALMHWANRIGIEHGIHHRQFTDDAARIGTMGHAMVEAHVLGKEIPTFPQDIPDQVFQATESYRNFLDWFTALDFHLIVAEYPLVSEFLLVGGTIDIMALINGEITLLDLKTSNGVYDDHRAQVAAYKLMWDSKFPQYPISKVQILQIAKSEGGFAHYQLSNLELERGLLNFCLWRILDVSRQAKTKDRVDEAKAMMDRFNYSINADAYDW
jgi:hypothetical protein